MSLENVIITVSRKDKQLEKFRGNYPNLRSLKGFLAGEWDLSLFDKCFPGRNRVGDVDGSVELNSWTLHIEFKGAKNGMNKGQVLKALRQAKYSGITTIFIFGPRNQPEAYMKIAPSDNDKGYTNSGYTLSDMDGVQDQLLRWSKWTEQHSRIESKTEEWNEVTEIMKSLY